MLICLMFMHPKSTFGKPIFRPLWVLPPQIFTCAWYRMAKACELPMYMTSGTGVPQQFLTMKIRKLAEKSVHLCVPGFDTGFYSRHMLLYLRVMPADIISRSVRLSVPPSVCLMSGVTLMYCGHVNWAISKVISLHK